MLELLIVIAIVTILAAASIPMVNSIQTFALDHSVSQAKEALQFARGHAKAMNTLSLVHFDNAAGTIRVTRMETQSGSPVEVPVKHPLTKTDYIVALASQPLTGASHQLRAEFTFSDGSKAPYVAFNKTGMAGRPIDSTSIQPIKEPGTWRGSWRSTEGYSTGDYIEHEKLLYDCQSSHVAGSSFASDLSAGRWKLRTQSGQVTVSVGAHKQDIYVEPNWGFIRVQPK